MADLVQLRGIRVMGYCGTLPEEQENRQEFEIDLDLEADQTRAGQTDDLADAVDYGPLCEAIAVIAEHERFFLIEKMAQRIVDQLFESDSKIDAMTITLRKLNPPVEVAINTAAVHIHRTRK